MKFLFLASWFDNAVILIPFTDRVAISFRYGISNIRLLSTLFTPHPSSIIIITTPKTPTKYSRYEAYLPRVCTRYVCISVWGAHHHITHLTLLVMASEIRYRTMMNVSSEPHNRSTQCMLLVRLKSTVFILISFHLSTGNVCIKGPLCSRYTNRSET